MASGGYRLPTPKAIITDCKNRNLPLSGTLFGEIRDLYNSLNFYQQQKYFTPNYTDINDLARILADEHNFPYEGSADFLSDFTQNVWGQKETRFSFADNAPTDAEIKEVEWQIRRFRRLCISARRGNIRRVCHGMSRASSRRGSPATARTRAA